jgi:hypothetical protein
LAVLAPFALTASVARADLELPRPSPFAKVTQDVGLTTITVDYSSPGVKGRKIWGNVVPFDKMWRTGANQATKITFSKDVTFAEQAVPAGTYALFTIPGKSGEWTIILNKNADQPGTATAYKQELDQTRVKLYVRPAPFRERLAFLITDFTDDKASLELEWDRLRLTIPVKVATQAQAVANITSTLDNTWRNYASAARYMLESKKDADAALKYADQSLALKEDWFNLWVKATILAEKKDWKGARELAQKSYDLGQKAGPGFFLEPEVRKAISDWNKKG